MSKRDAMGIIRDDLEMEDGPMTTETTIPTDRAFNEPLVLEVEHDHDAESPNEDDGFTLVSFSNRHLSSRDPHTVLECTFEDDNGEICEEFHPGGEKLGAVYDHPYQPPEPIAAYLSYFEHGLCRWARMGHGPADYGGFDTVSFAGVLLVDQFENGDAWTVKGDDKWRGFDSLPIELQNELVDGFLDEYTNWANGETYWYSIEQQGPVCDCCGARGDNELIDSCGGFIGSDYVVKAVREEIAGLWGVDVADLTEGTHYILKGDITQALF